MKLTVSSHGTALRDYAKLARHADALGYESFFVPDHMVAPLDFDPVYPYRESGLPSFRPETPFADPWVMIGHLTAVTQRIKLGVGVFILPMRNPMAAAKAIATAQDLSDGRVLVGVGIGWMREEFEALGEAFKGRAERTEEMLAVMRKLWTGQPVEHDGKFYNFKKLQMSPGMSVNPPILWGGASPAALVRAARVADGWYGPPSSFEDNVTFRASILAEVEKAGRNPADFAVWARANVPGDADLIARYRDAGFTQLGLRPPPDQELQGRLDWMEEVMRWNHR